AARPRRARWATCTTAPAWRSRPTTRPRSPSRAQEARPPPARAAVSAPTTPTTTSTASSTTAARPWEPRRSARSARTTPTAMGTGVDYTFNWFYVDAKDIGYQHSCKCPQRAMGVDPYLPVWGTGEWDWQGFIPFSAQPNDLNPPAGFLTSWNNKQAPGFKANDRQFSYGPVFRNQMLAKRIQAAIGTGPIDRA